MARYAASGKALATAANTNLVELRSTASQSANLLEFSVWAEAATAFVNPGLFLTTVVGTAGTAVTPQKEDQRYAAAACSIVTGPTGGTVATVAHRRGVIPATIGAGIIWIWPDSRPLNIPLSLSLIFRNDGVVGPAVSWHAVWDE